MKSFIDTEIEMLVKQIRQLVNPVKIILFGSYATGKATEKSDIDLLVVIRDGLSSRETAKLLYQKVEGIKIPYDILVINAEKLSLHKDNPALIYSEVLRHGKEVYAA